MPVDHLWNHPPSRGPNPHEPKPWEVAPVVIKRLPERHPEMPWPPPEPLGPRLKRSLAKGPLSLQVDGHVTTISSLSIDQAMHLHFGSVHKEEISWATGPLEAIAKQGASLTFRLDYPLNRAADVLVTPVFRPRRSGQHAWLSVSAILWQLAKAYEQIYAEETEDIAGGVHPRWGIWGHAMSDLVFETLDIVPDQGIGRVGVGS